MYPCLQIRIYEAVHKILARIALASSQLGKAQASASIQSLPRAVAARIRR